MGGDSPAVVVVPVSASVEFLDAGRTTVEWTTETDLNLPDPAPGAVLALWGELLVVVTGSVADIRALLVRALHLLPTDNQSNDND